MKFNCEVCNSFCINVTFVDDLILYWIYIQQPYCICNNLISGCQGSPNTRIEMDHEYMYRKYIEKIV